MTMAVDVLKSGLENVSDYILNHTLTCLIPAFFIAGAIAAFVKKEAILAYFGPSVKRVRSYTVASTSGTILAVCSCTILPLFAGIYRKGSGLGPAIAFLYAGPAINILAIVYTAQALGYDIGIARAFFAILLSVVIGLIMTRVFPEAEQKLTEEPDHGSVEGDSGGRSTRVTLVFFALLVGILVFGASTLPWVIRLAIVYILTLGVAYILIYHFERDEVTDWGYESWDLAKKILPILIAGSFFVGVFAYFVPPETFGPYLGGNSVWSNLLGASIGAVLYMPTLLEVPIIGTTFGYHQGVIGPGPALALLLAGPAVSLPSMVVLQRIMGTKKTAVYILLVIIFSTIAGLTFGAMLA